MLAGELLNDLAQEGGADAVVEESGARLVVQRHSDEILHPVALFGGETSHTGAHAEDIRYRQLVDIGGRILGGILREDVDESVAELQVSELHI